MQVRIRYCRPCRYRPRAENLADVIGRTFGAEVTLEPGNFGVFKVWVDGDLVFDKYQANGWIGRFGFAFLPPDQLVIEAIERQVEAKMGAAK
jgi:selT/selW/selH-like putative selenoprotein